MKLENLDDDTLSEICRMATLPANRLKMEEEKGNFAHQRCQNPLDDKQCMNIKLALSTLSKRLRSISQRYLLEAVALGRRKGLMGCLKDHRSFRDGLRGRDSKGCLGLDGSYVQTLKIQNVYDFEEPIEIVSEILRLCPRIQELDLEHVYLKPPQGRSGREDRLELEILRIFWQSIPSGLKKIHLASTECIPLLLTGGNAGDWFMGEFLKTHPCIEEWVINKVQTPLHLDPLGRVLSTARTAVISHINFGFTTNPTKWSKWSLSKVQRLALPRQLVEMLLDTKQMAEIKILRLTDEMYPDTLLTISSLFPEYR